MGPGEEWDEALGYLDACGPGVNLIARTSSELPGTRWGSLISQGSGTQNSWLEESNSSDVRLAVPFLGLPMNVGAACLARVAGQDES